MRKMMVFYAPTQANGLVVSHLKQLGRLKEKFEFAALSPDEDARIRQLQRIGGRAAYIWGDGLHHHESHFFTLFSRARLKINVDHHEDSGLYRGVVNCANHMKATQLGGVEIITPGHMQPGEKSHLDTMRTALKAGTTRGLELAQNTVAVTIDGDAIAGFPAYECWIYGYGMRPAEPVELIGELNGRISRLDFGGLAEEIPEFRLIEDLPLGEIPSESWAKLFAVEGVKIREGITDGKHEGKEVQEIFDRVGTYVTLFYAKLLEAFAEAS